MSFRNPLFDVAFKQDQSHLSFCFSAKRKKYNKVDTNLGISSTQAVCVFLAFKRALCK